MPQALAQELDALAAWRQALQRHLRAYTLLLGEHELLDEAGTVAADALDRKLGAERLVLACVAEVSRGKSELLNAIFFGDAGQRMLPASPGRTTMCPVELHCHDNQPAELALLPIETRLGELPLAELRRRPEAWQRLGLDPSQPEGTAQALRLVTQTRRVDLATAAQLGFWNDDRPHDNPPLQADGSVEIPTWRHAMINIAHPLLQHGLVVVDTPGLNAVGAEPELTLGMLPGAHAVIFLLAADTGVSRTDLELWSTHLDGEGMERFVVLNKADLLADPLGGADAAAQQADLQRAQIAQLLKVPPQRVFALSARDALAARIAGDTRALRRSGVPAFEQALAAQLLPQRRALLARATVGTLDALRGEAGRRFAQRRRQLAEQLHELRGLRGRSDAKVQAMLRRLDVEVAEFEGSRPRLLAVRAVHRRQMQVLLDPLAGPAMRGQVAQLQAAIGAPLGLAAGKAFRELFGRLRAVLGAVRSQADEAAQMLGASFRQLNAEFGFAFKLAALPALDRFADELDLLERSYGRYVAPTQAWRLGGGRFGEQFARMLAGKLLAVFEGVAGEAELWSRAAVTQIDAQLRDRQRAFASRREALTRVHAAAGELETRIAELELADRRLAALQARADALADQLRDKALGAAPAAARVEADDEAAALAGAVV
jgi:hypothetical protein